METKKILGLDIGTNSIGAALINLPSKYEDYGKSGNIEWLGSRIIPIDGDYLQKFESGTQAVTKAAFRRGKRGSRRLKHRYKLRRTRLIKVFKALGWLDDNFPLDESRKFKQDINENGYSFKISDYLPFSEETIKEFEKEFGISGSKSKRGKSIVPEDWIIYFIRKKALEKAVTIPELVRIIYMFNQRRGFKSSRKDLKENTSVIQYDNFKKIKNDVDNAEHKDKEYETQFVSITKVTDVNLVSNEKDKKGNFKFIVRVSDERIEDFEISRKKEPEWKDKEFTFLVTQKIKKGKFEQLQPKTPTADDWALCTTALSEKIDENNQHPGEYFYEQIREAYKTKRNFKARQYPVYRWRYQKELEAIWNKQCELNPELKKLSSDNTVLKKLAEILYPTQARNNMPKLAEFQSKDLLHIISNDIIYYQRELKSQKNSISECRYEKRKGIDGEFYGLKCIPRSSPLFQEFRIWQDIHNIRVLEREVKEDYKTKLDVDVTSNFITDDIKAKLFGLFNSKTAVSEKDILIKLKENYPDSNIKLDIDKKEKTHSHRINLYARRDELKGNETLSRYRSVFKKAEFDGDEILSNKDKLLKLWHIDYSITSSDEEKSKKGITTALTKLLPDNENKQKAIEALCKLSEIKKDYGSFSSCAIKKLLPVMRCGEYWKAQDITDDTLKRTIQIQDRLNSINNNIKRLHEIADDDIQKQTLKSFIDKDDLTKGLNTYQAGYLIYDKHSEKNKTHISSIEEFGKYIQKEIPNNSLRNPVVEQVVRETMFLVRDVWNKYGKIDEIHIELGRNLKNNNKERQRISEAQDGNFKEKQRIKELLYELMNGFEQYVDEDETKPYKYENGNFNWKIKKENSNFDVKPNPESPSDIDKFRIWRNLNKQSEVDWAKKVKDEKIPTKQEIKKYALWLSQNCRSPYTGKIIPLSKLFDINQYEIEHVIPRAKMKNDGFNNLVISEWGVNKAKDKELAANFINVSNGKCVYGNTEYKLFTYEEYESYCKDTFKFQKSKLKNLLATEVLEDFIERQLNDTRYIGRKLSELLVPITKQENSIIFTGGIITSELKNNWGLNKVWKEIILPRFERLEEISDKKGEYIIHDKDEHGNPLIHLNVKENPKLDAKRIDHRHHALDALIIAATTREHIRYLNTLNAADTDDEIRKYKQSLVKGKIRDFKQPWDNFTKETKEELEKLIVSFKTNNKIISQPKNRTTSFKIENGKIKKEYKEQKANPKWISVRKSMFKEPLGVIWLKETKDVSVFDAFKIHIEKKITDTDKEKRKTASYVYDKQARQIIDDIVSKSAFSIDEQEELLKDIKNFLEKNSQKITTDKLNKKGKAQNKTVYKLNGVEYEKIKVAHFVSYKTKRMALTKKDYVESLTVEKMKNDFPYFSFVSKIFYTSLPEKHKAIIDNANLKIFDNRKPNAFNQLFLEHILEYDNNAKEAFSAEGIEKLNKKAIENPQIGKEIKSISRLDGTVDIGDMFNGGFYETDKGSNVYFVMYENQQTKERTDFRSIATHKAIEKIVKGEPVAEDKVGYNKIILSPGDLVYVPTRKEMNNSTQINFSDLTKKQITRIYKMVSCTGGECHFVPATYSSPIVDNECGSNNKNERLMRYFNEDDLIEEDKKGEIKPLMIKKNCIKLKVDRLGNVSKA